MPNPTRWEEMLPHQFIERRDARPVCYMGFGLSEPHGWYNAMGLDFLKARTLLETAAATHGGIVAPPFAWHITDTPWFHTGDNGWFNKVGIDRSLASAIPPDLFYRMLFFVMRSIDAAGFKAAILVTGHYGGLERDMRLAADYYMRATHTPLRVYACADYELIREGEYRGDHAGITETSQLMYLCPDMVDLSQTEPITELGTRFAGGTFAEDRRPSADIGKTIVDQQVASLGEKAEELLTSATSRDGWNAPSLTDTQSIWTRFEWLTKKYWVCSTSLGEAAPAFPGWEALGE